jgi:hypothetical protein
MAYNRVRLSLCATNWEPLVIEGQMIGVIKRREVPVETGAVRGGPDCTWMVDGTGV